MIIFYELLIILLIILSPIIIIYRLIKKKEDFYRFKEKFCFFTKERGDGKIIWFHGSSVGEVNSIVPLIEKLEKKKTIKKILITSNTLSSYTILSKKKFKKTLHQFFPIDELFLVNRFLNYWRPNAAIFIESEIWPNMINAIKKKKIPLILLNARITKKSFYNWKKIIFYSKKIFSKFDISLTQNLETITYLKKLGAKKIKSLGNLKFVQTESLLNSNLTAFISKIFKNRLIWCAASTHNGEEKICANIHKKLRRKQNKLLTVIIPRHINRKNEIINELKSLQLKVVTFSSKKKIDKHTDIYLVDSYGDSKEFYSICNLVFLGGSIINHGGQNPLEAARFGCHVIHGPNIQNFKDIYYLLNKHNISHKIRNNNDMLNKVASSIGKKRNVKNKNKIISMGNKFLKNNLKELEKYI